MWRRSPRRSAPFSPDAGLERRVWSRARERARVLSRPMLFNSYAFVFGFLPLVLLGFFVLARASAKLAAGWLAAASLFFYGWWNPAYVALLAGSLLANYAFGLAIVRARRSDPARAPPARALGRREPRGARLLQVRRFFPREPRRAHRVRALARRDRAAARHLVLHFHADRLSRGCLPRRGRGIQPRPLRALRHLFSPPRRGPDPPPPRDDAAVRAPRSTGSTSRISPSG